MRIIIPTGWCLLAITKFAVTQSSVLSIDDLSFNEYKFRTQIDKALKSMETILENTKKPTLLGEIDHTYQDKYALVEFVANSGIASYTNALKSIGLDDTIMKKSLNWVHNLNQTVSLKFDGYMHSDFVKEEEIKSSLLKNIISSVNVEKSSWDYHYNLHLDFTLTIESGEEQIHLMNISESIPYVRTSYHRIGDKRELHHHHKKVKQSLNLTWLLRMISSSNVSQFTIDRYDESCKTPCRNNDVKKLLEFHHEVYHFAHWVKSFFEVVHETHQIYEDGSAKTNINSPPQIFADDIFIPIVPVIQNNSTTLQTEDLDKLLKLHIKTLESTTTAAMDKYKKSKFTTSHGMILQIISDHLTSLSEQLFASIGYVENMLETQLIEAIGKQIDSNDFEKFMKHHNRKFFSDDYAPVPFSRAIHGDGRYPDGVISIKASDREDSEPIETLVRKIPASSKKSMVIPIDAATKVELEGDQYLHGWVQYIWGQNNHGKKHNILARANQFSSYLLVIGVLGDSNIFIPKEALIVKDKDEVIIPLLSEILPSAKEFKDKIVSLSPEQQEFAKAFRAMQLESSVFGISVIPLKPQMENLLNLPEGALTKEIQLMQDLMSLFVEYQIPSDLLSFDGIKDTAAGDRVEAVKGHVSAVLEVIQREKKKQLAEAKDRAKMMVHGEQHANQRSTGNAVHQGRMYSEPVIQAMPTSFGGDELLAFDAQEAFEIPSTKPSTKSYSKPKQKKHNSEVMESNVREEDDSKQVGTGKSDDFTFIPKILDAQLEEQNEGAVKSTIIKAAENWERLRKDNLFLPPKRSYLKSNDKETEKNEAMDLLKAISRSGCLPIAQCDFHVIISMSHCFQKNLLSSVIQDNINPIKQVEKSLLIVGSVIQGIAPPNLLSLEEEGKKRDTIEEAEEALEY